MCISLSRLTCQMQIMFCFRTMEVYVASTMYFSALDLVKISKLIEEKLLEYQIIFQKKVLQNEKQIGWRYPAYIWIKAPSGTSKPTTTKRNKLQPQQPKTFNTTKTSQSKRPYKLKHQNNPFRSLPPPQGFQFAYKSPSTKSSFFLFCLPRTPSTKSSFSYFVFQEPSILILQQNSLLLQT